MTENPSSTDHGTRATGHGPRLELIRGLGAWASGAIVVGTMIGTGIFLKPAEMAREGRHRLDRLRRVDCRRDSFPLRRAFVRRTGRRHPRSRRRVRLPPPRLRPRLGFSLRLDAFHRRPPQFPLVHRRGPDALSEFSSPSRRRPHFHAAHRHSRPDRLDQALRFRLHLGAASRRPLDRRHDRHQLPRRPPGRRRPGFSHRHQNHVRCDCDWRSVLRAFRTAPRPRSHLADML